MSTFYRLLGFLRPYKQALAASWALASLAMVVTVLIPHFTGSAVEAIRHGGEHARHGELALRAHDRHTLLVLALVIVGIVLARWLLTYMRRMIAGRVSLAIEVDLRELIYGHLQRLELGFFDHQQTGQLMSRATVDLQAVRFFLGYGLVFILQSILTLVLAAIAMILINPELGLIAMVPTPFVVYIAQRYGRAARPAIQEVQQRIGELTADAEENIAGVRVVKSFAREPQQLQRFRHSVSRVFDQSMVATRLEATFNPVIGFLPQLGLAAVLLLGGERVIHHHLTLGQFTAVLPLPQHARRADARARHDARPRPARDRVRRAHLPGARPRPADRRAARRAGAADPATATSSCATSRCATTTATTSAAYHAGPRELSLDSDSDGNALAARVARPVLDDVSLDIPAGSTVALVGATGSGKTSLVALISRLYDVSSGEVLLDGADVRGVELCLAAPRRRRRLRRPVPVQRDRRREHRLRAAPARAARRSKPPRAVRRPTSSSSACRRASTRASASAACRCPAASASASRSRARCSPTRACSILDDATSVVDASTEQRDQARARRGDGRAHDVRHRPPSLDDLARR